ncbi:MAG: alpha-L-fucosidase [Candidatus Omnitrophica bacterium]|nr:alpha-L-fucosidase [Candidatus Omnitrophota bacterium]MCM8802463.1 alpha-L-fucosidase [Candidatus Omnitrophota bacterium]
MDEIRRGKGDCEWFIKVRFGLFIHWGLYSLPARHEWVRHREEIPNEVYDEKYFKRFNPDLYNPEEWAFIAKRAGMKYTVITTKHHEGFCLWDSKLTDYKATNTPCKRDLLREFVDAFRKHGFKIGFYYSLIDWHHPHFTIDKFHPLRNHPEKEKLNKERDMSKYREYLHGQIKELLTEYGKIDILWADFSYPGPDGKGRDDWDSENLVKMVRQLQPHILLNNRLDLEDEFDFITPEQVVPYQWPTKDGKKLIWESCQTFSGSWGYHRDETTWRDPEEIIKTLIDCVSKGGNLLLNVGPTARGEFDYRVRERLEKVGEWMFYHSDSIYNCTQAPEEFKVPENCKLTYNSEKNRLYVHIFSWPYKFLILEGKSYKERVEYAQLLNDRSEIKIGLDEWYKKQIGEKDGIVLVLPPIKPKTSVPVIEIFLK